MYGVNGSLQNWQQCVRCAARCHAGQEAKLSSGANDAIDILGHLYVLQQLPFGCGGCVPGCARQIALVTLYL